MERKRTEERIKKGFPFRLKEVLFHSDPGTILVSATVQENNQQTMLKKKALKTSDALRAAASKGCLPAVRFFVKEGVSKTNADKQGRTPLMLATQKDHSAVVKFLNEKQPTNKDKLLIGDYLYTCDALHAAAKKGAVETVEFLVVEGVNKDDTDIHGATPLMNAVEEGHFAVVKYLRECGADKDKADNRGYSPLLAAAEKGRLVFVQYLLDQGADVNKASTISDRLTPLHAAAKAGHAEVLTCLMNYGASLTAISFGCTFNSATKKWNQFGEQLPIDVADKRGDRTAHPLAAAGNCS